MKTLLIALASLMIVSPQFVQAADQFSAKKCSADEIEKFFCPGPGNWWYGPYYDEGCEVACSHGKAVCKEASCDTWSGEAIPSSCSCE